MISLTKAQKEHFIEQGYLVVPGLLSQPLVDDTLSLLCDRMKLNPDDSATWAGKPSFPANLNVLETTHAARTQDLESVAEQLVGESFLRGVCFSPFMEWNNLPSECRGFIPALSYPTEGKREVMASNFHIDGGKYVTTYPGRYFLAIMAYLSDVSEYGGATVVRPGSHRQVFQKWLSDDHQPEDPFAVVPNLPFADPVSIVANAGDVCFMHYLMVHSGSANFDDRIRFGLNTAIQPDPTRPYSPKSGAPKSDWTPLDYTLRTD